MPRIVGLVEHVETSAEVQQWLMEQEEGVSVTMGGCGQTSADYQISHLTPLLTLPQNPNYCVPIQLGSFSQLQRLTYPLDVLYVNGIVLYKRWLRIAIKQFLECYYTSHDCLCPF